MIINITNYIYVYFILLLWYVDVSGLWQPTNGQTRKEWMRMDGMSAHQFQQVQSKMEELKALFLEEYNITSKASSYRNKPTQDSNHSSNVPHCRILYTAEQLDFIIREMKNNRAGNKMAGKNSRRKRAAFYGPNYKWQMPIVYKIDDLHTESQKQSIRKGIALLSASTCVTMQEINLMTPYTTPHVLFTKQIPDISACYSYVGKRYDIIPQIINLDNGCVNSIGTIQHEIMHVLGAIHEHSRSDRNSFVKILLEKIKQDDWINYNIDSMGDVSLAPYDFNSIMHYPAWSIEVIDSLFKQNIGQRNAPSFFDIKTINSVYCSDKCSIKLSQPCRVGGYQNPLQCSSCICPDGFGGQFCEQIASPKNAFCGGSFYLDATVKSVEIKSPGYDYPGYYDVSQECTWSFKTPIGSKLNIKFVSDFFVDEYKDACYHWVEVKFKSDLSLNGAKFCGTTIPTATITSETNEMMAIFKSDAQIRFSKGFDAIVSITNLEPQTTPQQYTTPSKLASSFMETSKSQSSFTETPVPLPVLTTPLRFTPSVVNTPNPIPVLTTSFGTLPFFTTASKLLSSFTPLFTTALNLTPFLTANSNPQLFSTPYLTTSSNLTPFVTQPIFFTSYLTTLSNVTPFLTTYSNPQLFTTPYFTTPSNLTPLFTQSSIITPLFTTISNLTPYITVTPYIPTPLITQSSIITPLFTTISNLTPYITVTPYVPTTTLRFFNTPDPRFTPN